MLCSFYFHPTHNIVMCGIHPSFSSRTYIVMCGIHIIENEDISIVMKRPSRQKREGHAMDIPR